MILNHLLILDDGDGFTDAASYPLGGTLEHQASNMYTAIMYTCSHLYTLSKPIITSNPFHFTLYQNLQRFTKDVYFAKCNTVKQIRVMIRVLTPCFCEWMDCFKKGIFKAAFPNLRRLEISIEQHHPGQAGRDLNIEGRTWRRLRDALRHVEVKELKLLGPLIKTEGARAAGLLEDMGMAISGTINGEGKQPRANGGEEDEDEDVEADCPCSKVPWWRPEELRWTGELV